MKRHRVLLAFFLQFLLPFASLAGNEPSFSCRQIQRFYLLGTAGVTGGYFTLGRTLSQEMNVPGQDLLVIPETTGGSVSNLEFLLRGDIDLAFVQSDLIGANALVLHASGSRQLKVLGALYPEVIQIVARADRDIRSIADLKGKRIAVGEEGSGSARNALMVLSRLGIDRTTARIRHESTSRSANAMANDELDIFFMTGNLPSPLLQTLDARIPIRMLSIPDDVRESLLSEHSYFTREIIPGGLFAQQPEDTPTIGLRALLVTTSDLPPTVAERLLEILFVVFPGKRLGAIFDQLSISKALDGIDPGMLHPSAIEFFKRQGLSPTPRNPSPQDGKGNQK